MKKLIKILPILMTVMMVFTAISPVFASSLLSHVKPTPSGESTEFWTIGNNILGVIQIVGSLVAVGVLMVIGIKYMMGSAEEKAEYKKVMIPYIIGAILLFAAVNIAKAVVGAAGSLTTTK